MFSNRPYWELWHDPDQTTLIPNAGEWTALDFLSPDNGWAVGQYGTIAHWDGTVWKRVFTNQNLTLTSISGVSNTEAWAVGSKGVILHYNDSTAALVQSPTSEDILEINILSATSGWAIAQKGMLRWDGSAWSVTQPDQPYKTYTDLDMNSTTDGWVVGNSIAAHWDGSTWVEIPLSRASNIFLAVDSLSPDQVWVVEQAICNELNCDSFNVVHHWDGNAWTNSTMNAYSVRAVSPEETWFFTYYFNQAHIVRSRNNQLEEIPHPAGANGLNNVNNGRAALAPDQVWVVYKTGIYRWDGTAWITTTPPNPPGMIDWSNFTPYDLDLYSGTDGWVVGAGGLIAHWDGKAWRQVSSPVTTPLYTVDIITPLDVWAAGEEMIHWDGTQWQKVVASNLSSTNWLTHIAMISDESGWGISNTGQLQWDGQSWTQVTLPGAVRPMPQLRSGTGDNGDLEFASLQSGWLTTSTEDIYHWNGQGWSLVETPLLSGLYLPESRRSYHAVSVTSDTDAWFAARQEGFIVHWNGTGWESFRLPIPIQTWWLTVDVLEMNSSTDGWALALGTLYHWDGKQWYPAVPGAHSSGPGFNVAVTDIDLLPDHQGFAVGNGAILRLSEQYPLFLPATQR